MPLPAALLLLTAGLAPGTDDELPVPAAPLAPDVTPEGEPGPADAQSARVAGALGPDRLLLPAVPELLPALLSLRATPGGQSPAALDAEVPGVRELPLLSGSDGGGPPAPVVPVEPLVAEVGGEFGSTGLPVPMVREDTPDPPGDDDWADAMPAAARIAAASMVDDKVFIRFLHEENKKQTVIGRKEHATGRYACSDAC